SSSRMRLSNGCTRSDQACPGEMSKTLRVAKIAEEVIVNEKGFELDFLDLSRLASEYGRIIYPCKACVSTAMPLCHWRAIRTMPWDRENQSDRSKGICFRRGLPRTTKEDILGISSTARRVRCSRGRCSRVCSSSSIIR